MKLKITLALGGLFSLVVFAFYCIDNNSETKIFPLADAPQEAGGGAQARYKWEIMRLADPSTGKIPSGVRTRELEFASMLPKIESPMMNSILTTTINPRGPWNVGGRTRSIAIDITNENIIFAGSVNGGLWRSIDNGVTWNRVSPIGDNPAITSIAQDKRPGHTNIWYYTTGEGTGTSASGAGAFYMGNGAYKSVDGGITWSLLPSTSSGTINTFDNEWDIVWRVVTDPKDTVNDKVYVATYGVIFGSSDGGATWSVELGNISGSSYSYYTDVTITSDGVVYAALDSDGPSKGLWRKDTTGAWANITPASWIGKTYERIVMAVNPSNENEIYFLGHTPNLGKMTKNYKGDPEWNSLLKYTYVSGNGTGSGGTWTDLSVNIPSPGDQLGNFNAQGGYNMVVKVHPADQNIIYIGGTNLYRSTSGFTDSTNTVHIGGYLPNTSIPHYINYPDNHSDQHDVVFYLSDPYKMLQANDGGIYRTLNDTAANVVWQDLNSGFVTGQFYTIAIDHGSTPNDIIIGGLQDNGVWFTNSTNYTQPWTHPGWGDGAFCAIDNGHNYYYMARQEGRTIKAQLDANGNVVAYNRMDPIGASNYLFISPFTLDPNNNNRMYFCAGGKIWRNDSLDQIPLTNVWDSITTGWYQLPVAPIGRNVTAITVCKTPANRVYYGTNGKYVYRIDSAHLANPIQTNITSAQFPTDGNVNCIAVDPNNGNKLLAVFSNYNIYSLFYSDDAGLTWAKVAGNLEASSTGLGNGPSLRWASIVPTPNGNVYLIASSIGLYGTNHLDGLNTIWTNLSPNEIGYTVVDMIDFRTTDGLVAIGTHGSGVFSTYLTDTLTGTISVNPYDFSINTFPNPALLYADVSFSLLAPQHIALEVYSVEGKLVCTLENALLSKGNYKYRLNKGSLPNGVYYVRIRSNTNKGVTKKVLFVN